MYLATHSLQQKWDALDRLKSESTEEDFYRRFSMFFELMIEQGCTACATFVDIDPQTEDRAIKAGLLPRDIPAAKTALFQAMADSMGRTVDVEPDPKNGGATQDT